MRPAKSAYEAHDDGASPHAGFLTAPAAQCYMDGGRHLAGQVVQKVLASGGCIEEEVHRLLPRRHLRGPRWHRCRVLLASDCFALVEAGSLGSKVEKCVSLSAITSIALVDETCTSASDGEGSSSSEDGAGNGARYFYGGSSGSRNRSCALLSSPSAPTLGYVGCKQGAGCDGAACGENHKLSCASVPATSVEVLSSLPRGQRRRGRGCECRTGFNCEAPNPAEAVDVAKADIRQFPATTQSAATPLLAAPAKAARPDTSPTRALRAPGISVPPLSSPPPPPSSPMLWGLCSASTARKQPLPRGALQIKFESRRRNKHLVLWTVAASQLGEALTTAVFCCKQRPVMPELPPCWVRRVLEGERGVLDAVLADLATSGHPRPSGHAEETDKPSHEAHPGGFHTTVPALPSQCRRSTTSQRHLRPFVRAWRRVALITRRQRRAAAASLGACLGAAADHRRLGLLACPDVKIGCATEHVSRAWSRWRCAIQAPEFPLPARPPPLADDAAGEALAEALVGAWAPVWAPRASLMRRALRGHVMASLPLQRIRANCVEDLVSSANVLVSSGRCSCLSAALRRPLRRYLSKAWASLAAGDHFLQLPAVTITPTPSPQREDLDQARLAWRIRRLIAGLQRLRSRRLAASFGRLRVARPILPLARSCVSRGAAGAALPIHVVCEAEPAVQPRGIPPAAPASITESMPCPSPKTLAGRCATTPQGETPPRQGLPGSVPSLPASSQVPSRQQAQDLALAEVMGRVGQTLPVAVSHGAWVQSAAVQQVALSGLTATMEPIASLPSRPLRRQLSELPPALLPPGESVRNVKGSSTC